MAQIVILSVPKETIWDQQDYNDWLLFFKVYSIPFECCSTWTVICMCGAFQTPSLHV